MQGFEGKWNQAKIAKGIYGRHDSQHRPSPRSQVDIEDTLRADDMGENVI